MEMMVGTITITATMSSTGLLRHIQSPPPSKANTGIFKGDSMHPAFSADCNWVSVPE
ncbi:hypothetical protein INR49_025551 [Caranx melampygus]|nr:hypothetical protein INR49_025551 [Caranx melampygus]